MSIAIPVLAEDSPPAPPVNFRGTETLIVDYVGDNGPANESIYGDDDNYWTFRNILYLQAGSAAFDTSVRLDGTLFQDPPYHVSGAGFVPGGSGYTRLDYDNDYRVERLQGTAHFTDLPVGALHVTLGDFYVSFGRGMALSLIKLDDVGVDNTLRGARLEYQVPRKAKVILAGGVVNSLNIDPLTKSAQRDDPLDRIVGARVEWELLDALALAAHGVYVSPRFTDEDEIDPDRLYVDQSPGVEVGSGGASAELHVGGLAVYLEGNGQSHTNFRPMGQGADVEDEPGAAAFGEISYDLSPFNIKGEAIYYYRWLMEGPLRGSAPNIGATQPLTYHRMVTLEPVWMPIKSFGNVRGGRLTGDAYVKASDTQITLATAVLRYEGGLLPQGAWADHPPTIAVHPTLELRQAFKGSGVSASADGGFRYETTEEPEQPGEDSGMLWHAGADVSIPIAGPHSVEIKGEVRRHELLVTEGSRYYVTLESLGYDWSGLFGLTAVHEYSDQTAGSEGKIGDWTLPLPRQHYVWALATFHAPRPLDGLTLRLLGGSQRGGVKCAGGICRTYPDAVGVRLEVVYRF